MNERKRWVVVFVYAVAMAWGEAAVVLYLRTMFHRIDPYQANPMPMSGNLGAVEVAREAATMVMLLTVGILAGHTWRRRIGYIAVAFGAWDIFYYIFLNIMCGWPRSVMDWDVLFLIPLPWWGPVLAPMLIASLMIFWGTFASQFEHVRRPVLPELAAAGTGLIGAMIGLLVFMTDSMAAVSHGATAVRNVLPKSFNWSLFCVALLLMAAPVMHLGWQSWMELACEKRRNALALEEG